MTKINTPIRQKTIMKVRNPGGANIGIEFKILTKM